MLGPPVAFPRPQNRAATRFYALMALAAGLGLIKGFVFAGVVGSRDFGFYSLALLVGQYGQFAANLGIFNVIQNRLPQAYGRGDAGIEDQIRTALASLAVTTTVTMSPYFVIVAFVAPVSDDLRTTLLLAGVITVLGSALEFYLAVLRARRRLQPLGWIQLVRSFLALAVGIPLGAALGFGGIIGAEALALLVAASVGIREVPSTPTLRAAAEVLGLVRVGLPLMLVNVMIVAGVSIDRLFVASALPDELGQYTFSALVVVAWIAIGGVVNQVVVPQLLFDRGAGADAALLRRKLRRYMGAVVVVGVVGVALLTGLIEIVGDRVFSDFKAGLDIMPIMFAGGAASMLTLPLLVLQALRPRWALLVSGSVLMLLTVGSTIVALGEPSLTRFAVVFAGSQLVGALLAVAAVEAVLDGRRARPAPV